MVDTNIRDGKDYNSGTAACPFRLVCEVLEKVDYYFHAVVAGKKFKSLSKRNIGLYLYQYCLYF
jgi:hypothetical protein